MRVAFLVAGKHTFRRDHDLQTGHIQGGFIEGKGTGPFGEQADHVEIPNMMYLKRHRKVTGVYNIVYGIRLRPRASHQDSRESRQ